VGFVVLEEVVPEDVVVVGVDDGAREEVDVDVGAGFDDGAREEVDVDVGAGIEPPCPSVLELQAPEPSAANERTLPEMTKLTKRRIEGLQKVSGRVAEASAAVGSPARRTNRRVAAKSGSKSTSENRTELGKETRASRGGEAGGVLKHVGRPNNEG
jgi:hypothetical protein